MLNVVRYQTMQEIDQALTEIEDDEAVRVVVITGAGEKAFTSGGDISIMAKGLEFVDTLT